jgi:acetylornithine deacetylase/succinyl-diaminopimelate desuccinylase-like protein
MSDVSDILMHVDATIDARVDRLCELIRIPSVSTDPRHDADVRRAADWLAQDLRSLEAEADLRETEGHPMVVGKAGPAAGRRLLFYGHYDVQPADPLALWGTPPFEPTIRPGPDGETHIVGRGASDDKGQLMTFVEAARAWVEVRGALPCGVTFLFEGEEESGSRSLPGFLEAAADELACDAVLVCDTDMWGRDIPTLTSMLRGLCGQEMTITAANRDLHSGIYGGAARNALQVMADILASLKSPNGGVAIQGFYDGVANPPSEILAQWGRLPFDEQAFLGDVGLAHPAGEAGRSVLEQIWARPTCEINGVWGGYTDPGFKTVIASQAHAKVSFRLVAGQSPTRVRDAFQTHVRAHLPTDCDVTFADHGLSPATVMPTSGAVAEATLAALSEEWGTEAAVVGTGGSIPIVGELQRRLRAQCLLVGFARFDNRIHSPNEKYDLSSFRKGIRSWVRIIDRLAAT